MDIDLIRQHTPGCLNKIFLNSAGSSLVPDLVTAKMISYLAEEALIGGYQQAADNEKAAEDFYHQAAVLLNCRPENVAFTNSATDAYAKALAAVKFDTGDVILTTDDDYISNQLALFSLRDRFGLRLLRARTLADGNLDLENFEQLVKLHHPRLVAITHVPTNSGLVQAVEEIGKICREHDILYLLDACQSLGQLVVDTAAIGCDFLTGTGRKFLRGPRGTGLLYVSDRVLQAGLVPLIFDMQAASWTGKDSYALQPTARRFEFWEQAASAKIGFALSLAYLNQIGIQNIASRNAGLMTVFRSALDKVEGLMMHDRGTRLSSILTFTSTRHPLGEIAGRLRQQGVFFSMSSRQMALIDFNKKDLDAVVRFSPHYFNTTEELEKVADILSF